MREKYVLSKNTRSYLLLSSVINALVYALILGIGLVFAIQLSIPTFYIYGLYAVLLVHLLYKTMWYIKHFIQNFELKISEDRVDIKRGVWVKRDISIPTFRIQHVAIKRGPIQRKMGLSEITIHTAGSNYTLPAIEKELAEEAKEYIMSFSKEREEY